MWLAFGDLLNFIFNCLEQRYDIAVGKRKCLQRCCFIFVRGNVVGHYHSVELHISKGAHYVQEIHISVVGIDFLEVVPAAFDISQMYIKYLLPLTDPFNYGKNIVFRVFQTFCDGADAEVETV